MLTLTDKVVHGDNFVSFFLLLFWSRQEIQITGNLAHKHTAKIDGKNRLSSTRL